MNIRLALAVIAGFGAGYFIAKLKLQETFETRLRQNDAEARQFYKDFYASEAKKDSPDEVPDEPHPDDPEPVTPVPGQIVDYTTKSKITVTDAAKALSSYRSAAVEEEQVVAQRPEPKHPQPDPISAWTSTDGAPYVISWTDYNESEGYKQVSLTWWVGDDILSDEHNKKVPHVDECIGVRSLGKFGHESGDPNIVFVRNPTLKTEFEVTRVNGSYSEDILGEDPSPMM